MTSYKGARTLATKGHYLDFEPSMQHILPEIKDRKTNQTILPNPEVDDTLIKAEQNTGVNVWTKERLMINFHAEKDAIWDGEEFVVPLVYIEKESVPDKKLFEAFFNKLAWVKTEMTIIPCVLSVFAGLAIIFGLYITIKMAPKYKKNEEQRKLSSDQADAAARNPNEDEIPLV